MVVVWFNLIFSTIAALANVYAALRVTGWLRILLTFVAGLAALYAVSFAWLLSHFGDAADWSATMRNVGMVSWIAPWTVLPLTVVHDRIKFGRRLVADAEQIVSELGGDSS